MGRISNRCCLISDELAAILVEETRETRTSEDSNRFGEYNEGRFKLVRSTSTITRMVLHGEQLSNKLGGWRCFRNDEYRVDDIPEQWIEMNIVKG